MSADRKMNSVRYDSQLRASFSPSPMVNRTCALTDFLDTFYLYGEDSLSPLTLDGHLHLAASGQGEYLEPFAFRMQGQDLFLLITSVEGSVRLERADGSLIIGSGDFALLDARSTFALHSHMLPWRFWISFIAGPCDDLRRVLTAPYISPLEDSRSLRSLLNLTGLLHENVSAPDLIEMHRRLTGLEADILRNALTSEPEPGPMPWYLAEMHHFILHSQSHFSLQDFENRFGISRYRLCREYSAFFGISPLKDFNRVRIDRAKKMLLTSDMQIQEVSSNAGFETVNHFINQFRRQTGMTPGAFRKAVQQTDL